MGLWLLKYRKVVLCRQATVPVSVLWHSHRGSRLGGEPCSSSCTCCCCRTSQSGAQTGKWTVPHKRMCGGWVAWPPMKRYRNELVCTKTITLLAEVAAYSSFYAPSDYPVTKVLREPVYAEVRILARSDPNIILNLEHCWATSNPNPESLPQWDLLFNGYIKAI